MLGQAAPLAPCPPAWFEFANTKGEMCQTPNEAQQAQGMEAYCLVKSSNRGYQPITMAVIAAGSLIAGVLIGKLI